LSKCDEILSISQASKRYKVSRQAIFLCIQKGRLKASVIDKKWRFTVNAWNEYIDSKYHRRFSVRDGKKMYDIDEGILSPSMISERFGIHKQKVYYLVRKGIIPSERIGSAYIIQEQNFLKYMSTAKKKLRK